MKVRSGIVGETAAASAVSDALRSVGGGSLDSVTTRILDTHHAIDKISRISSGMPNDTISAMLRSIALPQPSVTDQIAALYRGIASRPLVDPAHVGRLLDSSGLKDQHEQMEALSRGLTSAIDLVGLSRQLRWAQNIADHQPQIQSMLAVSQAVDFGRLTSTAQLLSDLISGKDQSLMGASLQSNLLRATSLKMSAFAGALDTQGGADSVLQASFHSLLGDWRMRSGMPGNYWHDPRVRARIYREAEVDDGLIESEPADLIEVLVDSGVVEGDRTRAGTAVAVIDMGQVKMRIAASRPTHSAFQVLNAFEIGLRQFIAATLEAAAGADWFSLRVPGDHGALKQKRRAAQSNGEPYTPLINFMDLGDLIAVLLRSDNWPLFEPHFVNRDILKSDLTRLVAYRRIPAHARAMDATMITELILVIERLRTQMRRTDRWDAGWDSDR